MIGLDEESRAEFNAMKEAVAEYRAGRITEDRLISRLYTVLHPMDWRDDNRIDEIWETWKELDHSFESEPSTEHEAWVRRTVERLDAEIDQQLNAE